jgi:hypothetical protein
MFDLVTSLSFSQDWWSDQPGDVMDYAPRSNEKSNLFSPTNTCLQCLHTTKHAHATLSLIDYR